MPRFEVLRKFYGLPIVAASLKTPLLIALTRMSERTAKVKKQEKARDLQWSTVRSIGWYNGWKAEIAAFSRDG